MITTTRHHRRIAGILSLFVLPIALANDPDKKFEKMDANGDGKITREEHSAGVQRMFAEMDTNRDGIVTAAEMDAKAGTRSGDSRRAAMSSSDKIKKIDQNADGQLTASEHASGANEMFAKMDTNRDGSLTKQELEAGHKTHLQSGRN